MRFIYADESGISTGESILVVAAVIIDADSQWLPAETHLRGLIDKHVAPEDQKGFVFHATDLFQGSGKLFKDRYKYPLKRRFEALKGMLSIPSELRIPVVFGWTRKRRDLGASKKANREELGFEHAHALSLCVLGVETFMRRFADAGEVAKLTVEDNTDTKKMVERMHNAFRGLEPAYSEWVKNFSISANLGPDFFPLTRVVDGVHFTGKSGALLLQLADSCAWVIRHFLEERADIDQFVRAFVPRGPEAIVDLNKVRTAFAGQRDVRCWNSEIIPRPYDPDLA